MSILLQPEEEDLCLELVTILDDSLIMESLKEHVSKISYLHTYIIRLLRVNL